ncbi:MAG: hypothetical protein ACJAWN_001276 [Neolewinella sp.]|jgi:hypothetical protein
MVYLFHVPKHPLNQAIADFVGTSTLKPFSNLSMLKVNPENGAIRWTTSFMSVDEVTKCCYQLWFSHFFFFLPPPLRRCLPLGIAVSTSEFFNS